MHECRCDFRRHFKTVISLKSKCKDHKLNLTCHITPYPFLRIPIFTPLSDKNISLAAQHENHSLVYHRELTSVRISGRAVDIYQWYFISIGP
jgi:hypothetical protein